MAGIASYGIYLPGFKISDQVINPVKGRPGYERIISFTDEDIITMAFAAASDCLNKVPGPAIDAILFATTSPVFRGKYHASVLGDMLNTTQNILALDFCSSARSGTDAMVFANSLIRAGEHKNILVVASEKQFPEPGTEIQNRVGHASVAVLINQEGGLAKIDFAGSYSNPHAEEYFYNQNPVEMDGRFGKDIGSKKSFKDALSAYAKSIGSKTFPSKVAIQASSPKLLAPIISKFGLNPTECLIPDSITANIGNTGACHGIFQLLAACDKENKNILFADVMAGTNLLALSELNCDFPKGVLTQNCQSIAHYQDYLVLTQVFADERTHGSGSTMFASEMMLEREKESFYHLSGYKCKGCGTLYFLKTLHCKKCKDSEFEKVPLSRNGTIYSFTHEHYFPVSFPPLTMLVMNLEGGGRMTVQQTDKLYSGYPDHELIGMTGELVLRKMMEKDTHPNYFWKCKLSGN